MYRSPIEYAFESLTGESRFAFGGKLDDGALTSGKPQTIGQFLVEVADHLEARFTALPDTPPAQGWDKSARLRLMNAAAMLRREGQDLLESKPPRGIEEEWSLTRSMFMAAPWVWMVSALLDEVEGKACEGLGRSTGKIGGANGESGSPR